MEAVFVQIEPGHGDVGKGRGCIEEPRRLDDMERRFLLDVVVRERMSVLDDPAGEDEFLLLGRDSLLVLDLRLDVLDGVSRFDLQCDGPARQGLDEYLHGRRVRREAEGDDECKVADERREQVAWHGM